MPSNLIEIAATAVASAIFLIVFISTVVVGLGTVLLAVKLIMSGIERFKDWRYNRGK